MNNLEPLACCIVAPIGFDVRLLIAALTERGIAHEHDAEPSLPRIAQLGARLASPDLADFACVIIPPELAGDERDDLLLAVGYAAGRAKPVLYFGGPEDAAALGTFGLWIASSEIHNAAHLRQTLTRFLELAESAFTHGSEEPRPAITADQVVTAWRARLEALAELPAAEAERALADLIAQSFAGAGARVSEYREFHHGVDLAVWLDGAPHDIGEQLLIDIDYGRLTRDRLDRAASTLRPHLLAVGAKTGIVIYNDRSRRRFENLSHEIPIVPFLAADELFQALATGTLPDTIRRKRRAVHLA